MFADFDPLEGDPTYEKIRYLNKGSFGFVQLYVNKLTSENVAIKFVERGDGISEYVEREILNQMSLSHPYVVQLKEIILKDYYLGIVMEFVGGGDMYDYIVERSRVTRRNGLVEEEARRFFQQQIIALDYCHRMGVVSRDIKLENTLVDTSSSHCGGPRVKMCDFGFSKHEQHHSQPGSRVGTPAYFAPEFLQATNMGETYDGKRGVDSEVDPTTQITNQMQRILHADYERETPAYLGLSDDCKDILSKIFVADPTQRITIQGILRHPWYTKDLPPGMLEMNLQPQPVPQGLQSIETVIGIIEQARNIEPAVEGGEDDEHVENADENYYEEGPEDP